LVFVPLRDDNPRHLIRYPYVTWTLLALNTAIFLLFQSGYVFNTNEDATYGFGLIPAVITGTAELPSDLAFIPPALTFITSLFLHGDPLHLIGNLLFIFVFADNVEDSMGHLRFLVFYLLCGAAGSAAHVVGMPLSEAPIIGASGSVSGVVASYLLLHPRVKMWILLFGRIPLRVTAFWVIGAWIAAQAIGAVFGTDDTTGWWAHLGGFAAGAALTPLFKRAEVPWFGRAPKTI
jgi:membrane associated rhomboid family serine protease